MTAKEKVQDAERLLNEWLVDNTEEVFEEEPAIDTARALLNDALEELPTGSDVETTMAFFRKAYPEPQSKNLHTQLGCHFEEVAEMLEEMVGITPVAGILINKARDALETLSKYLKEKDNTVTFPDRVKMLDALCDQVVTACGVAHMSQMDMVGGYSEINRSNNSKFDDYGNPILDINKKMIKGPNYQKAELSPFV